MHNLIAIALGGSLGALARFYTANGIHAWLGRDFPHGTLFVNVSGSFLMGFLTQLLLLRFPEVSVYRSTLLVGFLGAYTTFSTFSLETFTLLDQGRYLKAATYAGLSIFLCIVATWVGIVVGRRLFSLEFPAGFTDDPAWVRLGYVLVSGFVLGLVAEWAFLRYEWVSTTRALITLVLLGVLTVISLGQSLPTLSANPTGHQTLLIFFAASAVGNALSMWAGMALAR